MTAALAWFRPRTGDRALAAVLAVLQFAALTWYTLRYHEMWRDEVQAWLIARDNGLPGLFAELHYEGHPGLWHLLLFAPAHLGLPIAAMQVLHAGIAAATTWVLVRYSPFPPVVKVLFPFGYLASYEYGVIARNYGLGVLLVFACCALLAAPRVRPHRVGATLFLLAQTSAFAALLVPPLCLYAGLAAWARRGGGPRRAALWDGATVAAWAAAGLLAMWAQMRPRPDTVGPIPAPSWDWIAQAVFRAMFPVVHSGTWFWERPAVMPGHAGLLVLAALAGPGVVLLLLRRPAVAALYALGVAALVLAMHEHVAGAVRHHGFFYVLLLACLWLYLAEPGSGPVATAEAAPAAAPVPVPRARAVVALLLLCLGVQVVGGARAFHADGRYTFSNARAAASVLRQEQYAGATLLFDGDYQGSPILGYLGRQGYYVNSTDRSYVVWNLARLRYPTAENVAGRAEGLAAAYGRPVVVVSATPLDEPRLDPVTVVAQPSTLPDEQYSIYLLRPAPAPTPEAPPTPTPEPVPEPAPEAPPAEGEAPR